MFVKRPRLSIFEFSSWHWGPGRIHSNPAAFTCKQWKRILSDKPFVRDIYLRFDRAGLGSNDNWKGQRLARWLTTTGTTLLNVIIWDHCDADPETGPSSELDNLLSHHIPRIISLSYQGPENSFIRSVFGSADSKESRHKAAPPCRAGELQRFQLNGLIKGISPTPAMFPKLEYVYFDKHWDVLSDMDTPRLTSLGLSQDSKLSPGQLQQLADRFPSLEELDIPRVKTGGTTLYLPFKAVQRLTIGLPYASDRPQAADYLSVEDCIKLETLTVWDTWSSDMLAFSISSNHVTTFTFEIYSGSRLWLDPKLFSLLPNLKSCHIERNQWEEILEDEWPGNETRAHNDMVLSGLLRKSHPEHLLPCPHLASLKGDRLIVGPSILLEILLERRGSPLNLPGVVSCRGLGETISLKWWNEITNSLR